MHRSHSTQLDVQSSYDVYFAGDATIELMRQILRGIDRGVLARMLFTQVAEPA